MAKKEIHQPTKANLLKLTIDGVNFVELVNGNPVVRFHVKELRLFEDICKFYFTGQLVIETMQNVYEILLAPLAQIEIVFESPRHDKGPTRQYSEKFKLYSYDSKPIGGGADARIEHTLSLIGQEFYNDKHNTVMQGFKLIPGTSAAAQIHKAYVAANGVLDNKIPSTGLIGSKEVPHQASNVSPVKAIHDILDRTVYAQEKTGAPVYFRNTRGYVMSPLKTLIETAPTAGSFKHLLSQGSYHDQIFNGYENVIHMRPLSPPGETSAAASAAMAAIMNSSHFFDAKTGNTESVVSNFAKILKLPMINNIPGMKDRVKKMLEEAKRGIFGARNMFRIVNDYMQARSVSKYGPGGYDKSEEVFLAMLTYAQKYWISVPIQTGLNVTCGSRIKVIFPIGGALTERTFFVPRLIHELKFTEGNNRQLVTNIGTTDIYCLYF